MNNKNSNITAYVELTLAMIIVGSLAVVGKLIIAKFPVMLSSVLAMGLASLGMLVVHYWLQGPLPKLNKTQFKYLFLQTICGVFLFRVFFLYGLYWSSAAMAGILLSLTPVIIAFLSVLLLREPITKKNALAIALCCIGMVFSQHKSIIMQDDMMALLGVGLILLAVICEALFTIFRKKISYESLNTVTSNTYLCLIGTVLFLPFGLYDLLDFNLLEVSFIDWLPIFYTALFVNIISFMLWFRGVDKVKASTAGAFTVVIPISAIILSYLMLDEIITMNMLVGMSFVLAGLVLIVVPFASLHRPKLTEDL